MQKAFFPIREKVARIRSGNPLMINGLNAGGKGERRPTFTTLLMRALAACDEGAVRTAIASPGNGRNCTGPQGAVPPMHVW